MLILGWRLPALFLCTVTLAALDIAADTRREVATFSGSTPAREVANVSGFRYSVSPPSGPAPLTVSFDASGSSEADRLDIQWRFPDGTSAYGKRVSRTFYKPGQYQVSVEVAFPDGTRARGSTTITAQDNGPERARVLVLADGSRDVTFDARNSIIYSPDAVFNWDFGDGTTASGPIVTHAFQGGSGVIRLRAISEGRVLEEAVKFKPTLLARSTTFEERVLQLTNAARAAGWDCSAKRSGVQRALPPLRRNALLDRAARAQSAGMALGGYFDHISAIDGSHPSERVTSTGYSWLSTGENIAAGQQSPEEVVDQWLRSAGHCKNIVSPAFQEIGIALVQGGSDYRTYWTQVFASPRQ
jgi:uncharacterized protein YkwD